MKNLKLSILLFVLFVYENYNKEEDLKLLNIVGKIFIYPAWFVHSILIWILSPVLIPVYMVKTSKTYQEVQRIQASPEYQTHMFNMMKKLGGF